MARAQQPIAESSPEWASAESRHIVHRAMKIFEGEGALLLEGNRERHEGPSYENQRRRLPRPSRTSRPSSVLQTPSLLWSASLPERRSEDPRPRCGRSCCHDDRLVVHRQSRTRLAGDEPSVSISVDAADLAPGRDPMRRRSGRPGSERVRVGTPAGDARQSVRHPRRGHAHPRWERPCFHGARMRCRCKPARCGDGIVDQGEECDSGDTSTGCKAPCKELEPPTETSDAGSDAGAGAVGSDDNSDETGGCSVAQAGGSTGSGMAWVVALLAMMRRRRSRPLPPSLAPNALRHESESALFRRRTTADGSSVRRSLMQTAD